MRVTLAVLCGGPGGALDSADATRLADELTTALRAAGAIVVDGLDELSGVTDQSVLLCADDLVAHPSLLWMLATEPTGRSTALVVPDPEGDLRMDRGRLVPGGGFRFAGAMAIAPADLPLLTEAIAAARPAGRGALHTEVRNPVDVLFPALLAAGLVPTATPVRLLRAERVTTTAELTAARAAVAAVDEDAARLRLAVKEKDDFFTTYAVSSWSPLVTRTAARLGLTPTAVTGLSVLFAVAAALAYWQASRPALVAGTVLLYLGFVLDCVDGQLARYSRRFAAFGGWLDTMADRAKEYAVYAGLAAGAERIGLPYAWPLAITAIVLQTVRHMTDTWYGALHDEATARPPASAPSSGVGARLSAASNRVQADTGSLAYWLKRIVVFPIGERWALIGVLAALAGGRVALAAVVLWGLLAFGYTLALRSLRSLSMRVAVLPTVDTARHRDDGWLTRVVLGRAGLRHPIVWTVVAVLGVSAAGLFGGRVALPAAGLLALVAGLPARSRHGGPLDWLVPAGLRAVEYLVVVAVALTGDVPPAGVFLLLFVLALRHYDLTARMEKGAPAHGGGPALLGWDGRVVLLVAVALAGYPAAGVVALTVVVGGGLIWRATVDWRVAGTA